MGLSSRNLHLVRTTAILNIVLYVVLESQIAKRRIIVQASTASEKCDKLEKNILKEKFKIKILEEDLQREINRSKKQTLEIYDLEKRIHSADQENKNLRENLRKTEVEIRSLKLLNEENEKKAKENENQLSVQSMEDLDKLRLSDATIITSRDSEKESELMENNKQLQTQLLMEREKVLRLEVQLREQQITTEPVEPPIHVDASTTKSETDLNETEPNISNVNDLNVMVPLASPNSADGNSEGKFYFLVPKALLYFHFYLVITLFTLIEFASV